MPNKAVLYAEDEFTNRKIMEIQCRRYGVECVLEDNGLNALKTARERRFDMVIRDQYMPGLNGDDVARELRKAYPDLPLAAITSDDGCIPRLKESGFDIIFVKPLRAADYKELLETYLL